MFREDETNVLICSNCDEGSQNPIDREQTFDEAWGTESDDKRYPNSYFPLDEND
jgi:hypothetical protein